MVEAHRQGWSLRAIGEHFGLPHSTVADFLRIALTKPPEEWELVFPPGVFTPASPPTVICNGDEAIDMVLHRTGKEGHPRFRPDRVKPKSETKHKFKPNLKSKNKKVKA